MKPGKLDYVVGDATQPQADGTAVIVHVCNDIGGWGKGFVMALSRRWPEPEREYRRWYAERDGNDFELGAVQFVHVDDELWIANLVGQRGLRRTKSGPPVRYDAIEAGSRPLPRTPSRSTPPCTCPASAAAWPVVNGTGSNRSWNGRSCQPVSMSSSTTWHESIEKAHAKQT